ncbi:unnamed protein product [Mycena citricolor]|uniref:Zn(2)-C6 fungal-type domain-containing protein n=1 Tax=Mycena citricolor TaxID=2018698 RepID=A0AAD2Q6X5_9AGAR|nr:unnamed protein product [Mycena citricolor]
MSDETDEYDGQTSLKKRKIQRACDSCRRKKIRCDAAQMPIGTQCSTCASYGSQCSYVEAAKSAGSTSGTWGPSQPTDEDDDDAFQLNLTENLQRLSLNTERDDLFYGRSSGTMLLQTALDYKQHLEPPTDRRPIQFWAARPVRRFKLLLPVNLGVTYPCLQVHEPQPRAQYRFPPPDLTNALVELYFAEVNSFLPLLHRPTFVRDLRAELHLVNDGFASTLLLVCAIGARYSLDPRVFISGSDDRYSRGWPWFEQVQLVRDPLGPSPTVYDVQSNALSVTFLHGSSVPQCCWTLVAMGIRMAQDVGAHRRKDGTHVWTVEDELWKRAFWVLIMLDRMSSLQHGRPVTIQDEDFDLDFPIECDDEFWETEDPALAFRQPKNRPSTICGFNAFLRLSQVLSFALRTLYSTIKSKALFSLTKDKSWSSRIVAELDSALDKWLRELPEHLRWSSIMENEEFFQQSVSLHCSYYHIRITVHRRLIPMNTSTKTSSAFSSLAVCVNAAKACCRVVDAYQRRFGDRPLPQSQVCDVLSLFCPQLMQYQLPVYTAGLILLLNYWGGEYNGLGLTTDPIQDSADVKRCMRFIKAGEERWFSSGVLYDLLFELSDIGRPLGTTMPQSKRERDANEAKEQFRSHGDFKNHGDPLDDPADSRRRPSFPVVPPINTQFHVPPASYYQENPISGTSPEQYRAHSSYPYPQTSLSSATSRSHVSDVHHLPAETPLSSTSSHRSHYEEPAKRMGYVPVPAGYAANQPARNWYPGGDTTMSHPPSAPPSQSPSFPVSEAFYNHIATNYSPYQDHPTQRHIPREDGMQMWSAWDAYPSQGSAPDPRLR